MIKRKLLITSILLGSLFTLASCTPYTEPSITEHESQSTIETTTPATTETTVALTTETPSVETTEPSIYDMPFSPRTYSLERAYPNLTFEQPLFLTHHGNDVFVVEKTGKIKRFENDDTVTKFEVFLDLSAQIDKSANEKGLLGFAFHPNYESNGKTYVYYTDRRGSVISEFTDADSEKILLRFDQPYANHNGGHLAFGPEGYLYIASGDGGSSGDPRNYSQSTETLLGKILRIDVDRSDGDLMYGIPEDNPFADRTDGSRKEIYAYGLRNPWRFSFDENRDLLIAADVGQNKVEEINIISNGGNYGWNIMEGTQIYKVTSTDTSALIAPIWEYEHPIGKSITGGYTYYGEAIQSLYGTYIYGDFISGIIWGLWIGEDQTVQNVKLLKTSLKISSFGLAPNNEVLIIDYVGGIYRLQEIE